MNNTVVWNKPRIQNLLLNNPLAVERAILAIYDRQTLSEQSSGETALLNGVGFSGAHSRLGSYYAKWIKSGKHLSGEHLDKARRIALRYTGQLVDIAKDRK